MSDTSNYRPVAVATVVSRLLEHFILSSTRMANLWRMRHKWRFRCLEVAHCILLMTTK